MRVLLAGAGHVHLTVLRSLAERPDARIVSTLVSPFAHAVYSGMLPGAVAGHYEAADIAIALAPVAAAANVRRVEAHVAELDLNGRVAHLDDGTRQPFDVCSLDVGATIDPRIRGAEHAIALRPIERFVDRWKNAVDKIPRRGLHQLSVIGGGAAGVEMLLAMEHRLRAATRETSFSLVSDTAQLLPQYFDSVRQRIERTLRAKEVVVWRGSRVDEITADAITLESGRRIASDLTILATGAASPPWLAASGLACDAHGFVRVDDTLRSVSHPFVFAAGDCASAERRSYPRSGVYAVRQAPILAENLRRMLDGRALVPFRAPKRSLALISTGEKNAVLSYGFLSAEGRWAWRLKDRIDRRYVERFRLGGRDARQAGNAD